MQRKSPSKGGASWVPKGSAADKKEAAEDDGSKDSPILNAPSTGPSYDKLEMLRVFQVQGGQAAAEKALVARSAWISVSEDLAVVERPADGADDGKTPGARKALREQKKAERAARRLGSGLLDESIEEDAAAPILDTPTGATQAMARQVSLQSSMGASAEATAAAYAYNAAMMQYLNSMAYAATPPMAYAGYTTVMLRNIPNRYSRDMLIERLNQSYQGQVDFVYLPIDFNSKCNVGYAFINFRTPAVAGMFVQEFHGKKTKSVLPGFTSAKVCEVSYARVQGRDANMENLRDEKFIEKLNERPEWQPLFYDNAGKEVDFKSILAGKRKGGKTPGGVVPATPPGYMGGYGMASPYGMMYPPATFAMPPPAPAKEPLAALPAVTLSTVLPNAAPETMLMLKDVPSTVTKEKAIELLNKCAKGEYDFLFIPKDSKGEGNRGFIFVNFLRREKADEFTKEYTAKKASEFYGAAADDKDKLCEALPARLGSLEGSIQRSQSSGSKVPEAERAAWGPTLFNDDGSTRPFPRLFSGAGGKAKTAEKTPQEVGEEDGEKKEGDGKGKKGEKGKAKGEGKGKKGEKGEGKGKGKNPYGGYGYPMSPMGMYGGFPGFGVPGAPGTPSAGQAAYMAHAMAMQGAYMQHAAAAASARGGGPGSVLAPLAAAVNPRDGSTKMTNEVKLSLRKQVEFYFSVDNLCKDVYLRQHMDAATGFTPLALIGEFPQVRKYRATPAELIEVMSKSKKLDLDPAKKLIRLKDDVERKRWAQPSKGAPAAAAAEAAAEKPAAESSEAKTTPP